MDVEEILEDYANERKPIKIPLHQSDIIKFRDWTIWRIEKIEIE
jgi:hypothetical protein